MRAAVTQALAFMVGPGNLVRRLFRRAQARAQPEATTMLRELARRRSASLPDLAGQARIGPTAAAGILIDLEEGGLVRLSEDKGAEHVRIAAITEAGREHVARLH